ncbi:MAG: sugar transferase [Terriglobales bacterium]
MPSLIDKSERAHFYIAYRPYYRWKRVIDVVGASVLLVIFAPLMLLITVLIKLDSRGSVFFVQQRVGARHIRRGDWMLCVLCTFPFYKFRSMVENADSAVHVDYIRKFVSDRTKNVADVTFKLQSDHRITRLGRLLRRSSCDELPQLFNVIRGDMSLVGPRPIPTYEAQLYRDSDFQRLTALPGITGIWQVKGRGKVPFDEMMRMDKHYASRSSFWLDLKILLLTIPAVLTGRGAM